MAVLREELQGRGGAGEVLPAGELPVQVGVQWDCSISVGKAVLDRQERGRASHVYRCRAAAGNEHQTCPGQGRGGSLQSEEGGDQEQGHDARSA